MQARVRQGNASSAAAQAISSDAVLAALADAAWAVIRRVSGSSSSGSGGSSGNSNSSSSGAAALPGLPPLRPSGLGAPSPQGALVLQAVRRFMAQHVLPAEATLDEHARGPNRHVVTAC